MAQTIVTIPLSSEEGLVGAYDNYFAPVYAVQFEDGSAAGHNVAVSGDGDDLTTTKYNAQPPSAVDGQEASDWLNANPDALYLSLPQFVRRYQGDIDPQLLDGLESELDDDAAQLQAAGIDLDTGKYATGAKTDPPSTALLHQLTDLAASANTLASESQFFASLSQDSRSFDALLAGSA